MLHHYIVTVDKNYNEIELAWVERSLRPVGRSTYYEIPDDAHRFRGTPEQVVTKFYELREALDTYTMFLLIDGQQMNVGLAVDRLYRIAYDNEKPWDIEIVKLEENADEE